MKNTYHLAVGLALLFTGAAVSGCASTSTTESVEAVTSNDRTEKTLENNTSGMEALFDSIFPQDRSPKATSLTTAINVDSGSTVSFDGFKAVADTTTVRSKLAFIPADGCRLPCVRQQAHYIVNFDELGRVTKARWFHSNIETHYLYESTAPYPYGSLEYSHGSLNKAELFIRDQHGNLLSSDRKHMDGQQEHSDFYYRIYRDGLIGIAQERNHSGIDGVHIEGRKQGFDVSFSVWFSEKLPTQTGLSLPYEKISNVYRDWSVTVNEDQQKVTTAYADVLYPSHEEGLESTSNTKTFDMSSYIFNELNNPEEKSIIREDMLGNTLSHKVIPLTPEQFLKKDSHFTIQYDEHGNPAVTTICHAGEKCKVAKDRYDYRRTL